MTDHIQPEPARRPKYEPAEFEQAHDPRVDELRRRVQGLEQEKRRWKLIGISALIALLLVLIGGGVLFMGTASFYAYRAKEAQMQAEMEAKRAQEAQMQAEMEAQRAQAAMEQARREAARQAEKGAK